MERPESNEEDDDLQTLVPRSSTFGIATTLPTSSSSSSSSKKSYLLAALSLLLLLLLLLLLFSRVFRSISTVHSDSSQMRESELQALSLLRTQQLSLLTLANSSTSIQFKSAVLDQIKINRQIQNALLSSHAPKNSTLEPTADNVDPNLLNLCEKVERPVDRKTIEWRPKKDRFLMALCVSGQMSNHLICLEKHMFFAALLDRVLVFPSPKVDYQYDEVLDLNHINDCFGRKVAISYDEFVGVRKDKKLRIDRFICYVGSPPCFLDEEHLKRLKDLGIELGKIEALWPEDAKERKRVVGDVAPKFKVDDEVIAIGDMFYANVEEEWVMQPGGPIAHKCSTLIQPSRLIILTAQRFMQTFLGSNFVALHFRRHGFLKFCNLKEESCFFPIPQAAECILRVTQTANAPVIYLSTDAAESEIDLLQSLLVSSDGKPIPLVIRPSHNSVEKWDALLFRNKLGENVQVEAMLDKTICAMSSVFIGAPGSTFTEDILRLRRGWGSAAQCDEYLCKGERPNFIAENE